MKKCQSGKTMLLLSCDAVFLIIMLKWAYHASQIWEAVLLSVLLLILALKIRQVSKELYGGEENTDSIKNELSPDSGMQEEQKHIKSLKKLILRVILRLILWACIILIMIIGVFLEIMNAIMGCPIFCVILIIELLIYWFVTIKKVVVNEPDPVVKVIYLDANGEEIYSVEFDTAE